MPGTPGIAATQGMHGKEHRMNTNFHLSMLQNIAQMLQAKLRERGYAKGELVIYIRPDRCWLQVDSGLGGPGQFFYPKPQAQDAGAQALRHIESLPQILSGDALAKALAPWFNVQPEVAP